MAKVEIDILDESSWDLAIQHLEEIAFDILPFMGDALAENVALEVGLDMAAQTHVITGELRRQAMLPFTRVEIGEYELEIDPVDPDSGKHYAQIELHNEAPHPTGTSHNFLLGLEEAAAASLEKNKGMFKVL